jgi:hypothetical protein
VYSVKFLIGCISLPFFIYTSISTFDYCRLGGLSSIGYFSAGISLVSIILFMCFVFFDDVFSWIKNK